MDAPSIADPTPLGPFFDALEYRHNYPVPLADRIRVARLLRNIGNPRRLGVLRLAMASLLARSPQQTHRFLEAFDAFFEDSPLLETEALAEPEHARWLAGLKALCERVSPDHARHEGLESAETTPSSRLASPASPGPRSRATTRERPGLTALRIIPWPRELERPSHPTAAAPGPPAVFRTDPNHPEFNRLDLGRIGCQRRPLLDRDTLGAVADSMGYFASPHPSPVLDVQRSIDRTVRSGVPTIAFHPWRAGCGVLLLEDLSGERHDWNTVPDELVHGLLARGVAVRRGTFRFTPEAFQDEELRTVRLEDLEAEREGLVLLIVSTGVGLLTKGERRILEDLARWPRVAWLDPREERFWDSGTEWVRQSKLPVFEATPNGLSRVAERLVSERGRTEAERLARQPASGVVEILGADALPWVAACSMLPRISASLAESLRREFFSRGSRTVPPHAWGRLRRLPGISWDAEAVHFEPSLAAELRREARRYLTSGERLDIARRLSDWLASEKGRSPADSVAAGVCEVLRLHVSSSVGALTADEAREYVRLIGPGGPLAGFVQFDPAGETADEDDPPPLDPEVRRILAALAPAGDHVGAWRPSRSLPDDMVMIPGGAFWMGDPTGEGYSGERPKHEVEVSAFALGKYPVTNERWIEVREWGLEHGYGFETAGDPNRSRHPVVRVSWHEAVRWCNALSEMDGRRPVYYRDKALEAGSVYREGTEVSDEAWVDWEADGYRLPTEAEWEKAARGGLEGHHYPWESLGKGFEERIGPERANYQNSGIRGTTEVGAYAGNGYGLHDMAGNVWEWCWDWWDDAWYRNPAAQARDTRGPEKGVYRVIRGGSWAHDAGGLRCACRSGFPPAIRYENLGFRLSLGPGGIGPGAGANERRRDAEERERRRRVDAGARGCLVVWAPEVEGVRVGATGPEGERMLVAGTAVEVEPGSWSVRCEAPGYAATTAGVEVGAEEAREVRMGLERTPPDGFAWIPGGTFSMGDPTGEGDSDERPPHEVEVSEFWMGTYPVTNALWIEVREWGEQHGYAFETDGDARKPDHPVVKVDWYEAVRWCNALSEKEGRKPVYYPSTERESERVYRTGTVDFAEGWVDWEADGYRLPTEAEWEKAARGGREGHHYPWESSGAGYGRFIRAQLANHGGLEGGTTAVGKYHPNGFGLHDMAGNVWEWCWDWLDSGWYTNPLAEDRDTRGPKKGVYRVIRGGCWALDAGYLRCAYRTGFLPASRYEFRGFRLSLGHLGRAEPAAGGEAGRRDDDRPDRPPAGGARGAAPAKSVVPKKKRIWDWFLGQT